jgi:signal transduction histidine kinase
MDMTLHTSNETSQQDLRVLLDNAPDAIARFDRRLRHVYVNEATARENNRPASDFDLKTMEELGHSPEVSEIINSNLRAVFESGEERTFEILFDGPFGTRWFQCRMAPEFNEDTVEFVLVMSREISEWKRAQEALRQSAVRAEAVNLTATLAHEINNPLAVLINAVYLLQQNPSLDDSARQLVTLAAESVDRISGISRQILSLYRNPNYSQPPNSSAK